MGKKRRESLVGRRLLERVADLVVLAQPDLLLLLGGDVLDPLLDGVLLDELADEAGVPELRGDAQVLAAPHQGVGLAALGGGGDAILVEVLLLAARLADESVHEMIRLYVKKKRKKDKRE